MDNSRLKRKILVVFTGGTIGSSAKGGSVGLNVSSRKELLDEYAQAKGDAVTFDTKSPLNILSENVQPKDLLTMYECVNSADFSAYDGIIITHGTDTLCFTVNWFSRVMRATPVPIVFVSSLYPLGDPRSNGLKNFSGAVDFIEQTGLKGVYCAFANDNENCKIHLGSRLIYPDETNGFYHSVLDAYFAEITDGGVKFNDNPYAPTEKSVRGFKGENAPAALSTEVMLITMRSLLNFASYDFSRKRPKAVVVELSHSGTVCTEGSALNFVNFAEYCKECGVEVVISPVFSEAGVYESMNSIPENVVTARDITLEMTLAKVMSAIGEGLPAATYLDEDGFFDKVKRRN